MSKVIPLLFVGAGAAAISVGGVYMLNSRTDSADLGFRTLEEFKKQNGGSCTKEFFGTVDFTVDSSNTNKDPKKADGSTNKVTKDHFQNISDPEQSCLFVNWEKFDVAGSSGNDAKWLGNFAVLWNVKKKDKGFSMFLAANPSESAEKQMGLKGGIYFLEKAANEGTWSAKKYKELENQTLSKSDFDNKFPKAKDEVKEGVNVQETNQKPLWGFVGTKDDLDKAAKKETGTQTANRRHLNAKCIWKPDSTKSKTMADWSENLETWANQLFTSTDVELKSLVEQLKGTWTKT